MINTKKHLRTQLDFALGRCARTEETDRMFKTLYEINMKALEKQTNRISELMKANGQLKRDLDTEMRQKEELSALLEDLQKREGQTENGSAAYIPPCTEECEYKASGPVYKCAFCYRNPALSDQFEEAES